MGIYCGVDMVEIQRIQESIDKYGSTFIQKIFTPGEIEYCESRKRGRYESYAARFAAKEAVSKALGTGFSQGVSMKGIELAVSDVGKPQVILNGSTKERFVFMGGNAMDISLTHSRDYAVAFAVVLTGESEAG